MKTSRRKFLGSTAITGLVLNLHVPFSSVIYAQSATQSIAPEVNAWVVFEPDDTVIICIACSEMGQGDNQIPHPMAKTWRVAAHGVTCLLAAIRAFASRKNVYAKAEQPRA